MEDPTKTVMDELARTSGVVGVERLAALFITRAPDAGVGAAPLVVSVTGVGATMGLQTLATQHVELSASA